LGLPQTLCFTNQTHSSSNVRKIAYVIVGFENAKDMIGVDGDKDFDIALGTRLSDFLKGLKYLGRGIESL